MDHEDCVKGENQLRNLILNVMLSDIFISVSAFGACFGIVYVAVTAKNRERLAMINKDMNPFEHRKTRSNTYALLKWSMLIIGLGLGVFFGSLL